MDEGCGWLFHPLCDAHGESHVREPSSSQVGQPVRCAIECFRQRGPRKTLRLTVLVQGSVHLTQIPSKAAGRSRPRHPHAAHLDNRSRQEVLRRTVYPPQDDQRVLAGHRSTPVHISDQRTGAQRMIRQPGVQVGGLPPEFIGQCGPAQPALSALGVKGADQCAAVEDRQATHVRQNSQRW